jgi:hypothetical protein
VSKKLRALALLEDPARAAAAAAADDPNPADPSSPARRARAAAKSGGKKTPARAPTTTTIPVRGVATPVAKSARAARRRRPERSLSELLFPEGKEDEVEEEEVVAPGNTFTYIFIRFS